MGFASNFGPCQTPKLNSVRSRLHSKIQKGRDNNPRSKVTPILSEPWIVETEFEKQLHPMEGFSDESDCMWLSDGNSASFFGSDDLQDTREIDGLCMNPGDHFLELSTPSHWQKKGDVSMLDRCTTSSEKEVYLAFDRTKSGSSENDDSCESSLSGYTSTWGSSCNSLNSLEYQYSPIQDHDTTGLWITLLDLAGEDYELVGDEEQGVDIYNSGFPSPSFNVSNCPHASSSDLGSITSSMGFEGHRQPIDSKHDEPIFWPFDQSSYWQPGLDNIFCISPKKETNHKVLDADQLTTPDLKLHRRKILQYGNKSAQTGCRRKLEFSSLPVSPAMKDHKGRFFGRISSKVSPDQLKKSSQRVNIKQRNQLKEGERRCSLDQLSTESLLDLEAREIQNFEEQVTIENLVGLSEFNGQEGIGTTLDENFSLLLSIV